MSRGLLLSWLLAAAAGAQTTSPEGLIYTVTASAATITGYSGAGGAVTIPSTLGGLPVTEIASRAFVLKTTVTAISIPASVTTIGASAFLDCTSLAAINVDSANPSYFSPAGGRALFNKSQTLLIQHATAVAGTYAIPAGVTTIGETAFQNSKGLTGVTIPGSVTTIGHAAFIGCSGLTSVTLPDSVTAIGDLVFAECTALASAVLPSNMTSISRWAFRGTALTSITLPAGVTSIGQSAFEGTRLTSILIPAATVSLQPEVFRGCNSLLAITVEAANPAFASVDGVMFDKAQATLVAYPAARAPTYVVPPGVTTIGAGAFHTNLKLTGITLPAGVTTIGRDSFEGCTALTTITIPATVTSIGAEAFLNCSQLATVVFAGSPPTAGASLFGGTLVTRVLRAQGATGWGTTLAGVPVETLLLPVISTHPVAQADAPGSPVTLSVAATGTAPLTFQWTLNGTAIAGATQASYSVANTQLAQSGRYQVMVTNAGGTVHSAPAEVRLTGSLWATGLEAYGQFGDGLRYQRESWTALSREVKAASAGDFHALFLKQDGTLWASGYNYYGALGDGTTDSRSVPVQVASSVAKIAAGGWHSLYLKTDGTLWGMGRNGFGQLGDGSAVGRVTPVQIASSVTRIAAGAYHSLFLKSDGTLWVMGRNHYGQLGDGSLTNRLSPVQIADGVVAVEAGVNNSLFLKGDGTLWGMGRNSSGQLGDGSTVDRASPVLVASGVTAMAGGGLHSLAVKADGSVWGTGLNSSGQLGTSAPSSSTAWIQVATGFVGVSAGGEHSLLLKADGTLWATGANGFGQLGDGSTTNRTSPVQVASEVTAVSAYESTSLMVTASGRLFGTGQDAYGQFGLGSATSRYRPIRVAEAVSAFTAGSEHTVVLQVDGALRGMGRNDLGQLGDGSRLTRTSPVVLPPFSPGVAALAAGHSHTLLLDNGGGLWGTGYNWSGQLGDGSQLTRTSPVPVASAVAVVTAGAYHSLWLTRDGTAWATGYNSQGQLGDGTTTGRLVPYAMMTSVAAIAAGEEFSLLLKTDGSLWATGLNSSGQLGDGTILSRSTPVQVATGVAAIAAGVAHTLFLKTDGSLWATGSNSVGQLGDGTSTNRSTPVQIATGVVAASAAHTHSLFLKLDGSLWGMGANQSGQLGDGTSTTRATPVPIATGVVQIGAGGAASFFVQAAATGAAPVVTQPPTGRLAAAGAPILLTSTATGAGLLDYRWQKDGVDLPGARGSSLYVPVAQPGDAGVYRVVVTNAAGSITSAPASVSVATIPVLTTQPVPAMVPPGAAFNLTVAATGEAPLAYQWHRNNAPIPAATAATLTVAAAQVGDVGRYHVVVSNAAGAVVSAPADVRLTGQLWAAGLDFRGSFGLGGAVTRDTYLPAATGVTTIEAGAQGYSLFLRGDKTLWSIGRNQSGQLGDGSILSRGIPALVASDVVAMAAGKSPSGAGHTLFIKADGSLWGMGGNGSGQLGDGTTSGWLTAVQVLPSAPVGAKAVSAGQSHSLLLKTDGSLWVTGLNTAGQLGDGTTTRRTAWQRLTTGIAEVSAGGNHSLYLTTGGALYAMGDNSAGQLGDGTTINRLAPVPIVASGVVNVSAGLNHSLYVKADGTLWRMGAGSLSPVQLATGVLRAHAASDASFYLKSDATLWQITGSTPVHTQIATGVTAFAGGRGHYLYLNASGEMWVSGDDADGQLGLGRRAHWTSPVKLAEEVGQAGTLALQLQYLRRDGTLWAAGEPKGWSPGITPTQLASDVVALAGGSGFSYNSHAVYVRNDGSGWSVGSNLKGALGAGSATVKTTPFQVMSTGVAAVSAIGDQSAWLKADGTLWMSGLNSSGQLGTGTTTDVNTPVQVASGVAAVSVGQTTTVFVQPDGSAWAMGSNAAGQFGNGTTTSSLVPVRVATGLSIGAVSAGQSHTLFLLTDGRLFAAGSNSHGQLGDGTTTARTTPVSVATDVVAISAGSFHSAFLKRDGTLWGMGLNTDGQLADGTTTSRSTPVQLAANVVGLARLEETAIGFLLAAGPGTAPVLTLAPQAAAHAPGTPVTLHAVATGSGPLDFRWQKDGVDLPGARGSTLYLPFFRASDAGAYRVVVSNGAGSVTSAAAALSLSTAPVITAQPASQAVVPGGTVSLSVTATGATSYQWRRDGVAVAGATQATLTLANAQLAHVGRYTVAVTNAGGTVHSGAAWVQLTGRAWGVGLNNWGQLGDEIPLLASTFEPVAARVRQVAVGASMVALIKTDDSLWVMGQNLNGQLGLGDTWSRGRPVQVATGVTAVSAGNERLLFIKADGTLWGAGSVGVSTTVPVAIAAGVKQASAGGTHALYVTQAGELWAFGSNGYGQLGDGTTTRRDTPVRIATGVAAAAAGSEHSLFLKTDGTVWAFGRNDVGQLGDGATGDRSIPVQIATGATAVVAGPRHNFLLKADASLWGWGDDAGWSRKLGLATGVPVRTPTLVTQGVTAVAAGGDHSLFRRTDGSLWGMGFNYYGSLGSGATNTGPTSTGLPVKVAERVSGVIAAGGSGSAYVGEEGTLWVAGADHWGQLGRGRLGLQTTPIVVGGPAEVRQASAGHTHSLLVGADGGLWGTGSNVYWSTELGDGTEQSKSAPVRVAEGVTHAWAGYSSSFFLRADRGLWGMGYNNAGQLGDGTTTSRRVPQQIAAGVSAVASGDSHTLFVTDGGQLMAMGGNASGQLGDGTITTRLTPFAVTGNVAAVAAGSAHSLFLKHDGTLWGMGRNTQGELGDGTLTSRLAPVQLMTGVAAMAAGAAHSLMLKQDGTLWAAGANAGGSLGDGTSTSRATPVQVATGVVAIAARDNNSRFLKADGSLWGMGNNWNGQLADSTTGTRAVPVLIANHVVGVSMGYNHTLFVQQRIEGTAPRILSGPVPVRTVLGESATFAVSAEGPGPLGYQWLRDGVPVPGAKDAVLVLPFLRSTDLGRYAVVVSNAAGSITTNAAELSLPAGVARSLVNGSFLGTGGGAGAALLGSFTIEGTVAKQMLIRAAGPALTTFGTASPLADPRLEVVHAGSGLVVATNDDWGTASNAAQVASAVAQVGAFAFAPGSKDAAILGAFGPGTYRVRVLGADATLGSCLLEIYDADTTPRLVQLATRAPVGGGATFTQGWVARDLPAGRSYLIRALGPTLGLAGALPDPVLTLYAGSTTLGTNDNWAGDAAVTAATATVGAMPLAAASKDAALLFTPPAAGGAYTATVTGAGGATGLALLEVHEVDAQRPTAFAPAILSPPEPVVVATGQPIALGVVVTGKPTPTFQWRKDGTALAGATQSSFALAAAAATDAGGYDVVVSNVSGTVTSPLAQVTVSGGHQATHALVSAGYVPGATVTITNTLTYTGTVSSLGWQVTLPPGWSFASDAGAAGDVKPASGATDALEWAWTAVPASPVTFTYTVNVPAGETATRTLAANGIIRSGGPAVTVTATPSPLTVARRTTHSADTDANFRLGLLELTRVIELYNTRNGTTRTGAYAPSAAPSEDGFAADPARLASAVVTLTRYHSADSNRDGKLGLLELTRVIELYNYRSGPSRTGQYHVQAGTEDGFDPGP